MATRVLRSYGVSKKFKNNYALKDITFSLKKGEIYGLIGQNGAGKSTLMKIIAGLSFASAGTLELLGAQVGKDLLSARKKTGSMIEGPQIIPSMNACDNLKFQKRLRGIRTPNIEKELLTVVGLDGVGKKKVRDFSLGMKQRLGIAITLLSGPEFLILDEPINGLDPTGVVKVRNLLRDLQRQGITILVSSHNLPELHQIATEYLVIDQGQLVKQMSSAQLEEECRKYILLESSDFKGLVKVLETEFSAANFEILPGNKLKLYDCLDHRNELAYAFVKHKIPLTNFSIQGSSLEHYYLSLIGRIKDDTRS